MGLPVWLGTDNFQNGRFRLLRACLPWDFRRTQRIEELVPWLYLKGVSSKDFQVALASILEKVAKGVPSSVVSRLKTEWDKEPLGWQDRDLSKERYPYIWVEGIHCSIPGSNSTLCLLLVFGVTDKDHKELVAIAVGYREFAESWDTVSVLQSAAYPCKYLVL